MSGTPVRAVTLKDGKVTYRGPAMLAAPRSVVSYHMQHAAVGVIVHVNGIDYERCSFDALRSLPPHGSDGRVERGTAHAALPANNDQATFEQAESDRGDAHIARTHAPKGSIG